MLTPYCPGMEYFKTHVRTSIFENYSCYLFINFFLLIFKSATVSNDTSFNTFVEVNDNNIHQRSWDSVYAIINLMNQSIFSVKPAIFD